MAYQYRGTTRGSPQGSGGPPPKPKHNWVNKLTRESRRVGRMLDKSKENYFKYDMEELLKKSNVPEERRLSIAATLFAKGSRVSTEDAKAWAKEKKTEGLLDEATYNAVLRLLEGYSTWR